VFLLTYLLITYLFTLLELVWKAGRYWIQRKLYRHNWSCPWAWPFTRWRPSCLLLGRHTVMAERHVTDTWPRARTRTGFGFLQ